MKKRILPLVIVLFGTGTVEAVPNPSAVFCTEMGYEYQIRKDAQGNQYGVCLFPDGTECAAWEYFRKCYYGETSTSCNRPCEDLPCKQAGESVWLFECCEGLRQIPPAYIYDANCNQLEMPPPGWLPVCSDCGNGVCEPWESKCNCPEDCAPPLIIYVDADASGANDGSSWQDAYPYLQDALDAAFAGNEIRVAEALYRPSKRGHPLEPRTARFQLINGIAIRGGYAGLGHPDPNARDITRYQTILSGDLNGDDGPGDANRTDNSYHVVSGDYTDATAVLDGFTITAGNASGFANPDHYGGGMYNYRGSPTVNNCTFHGNHADIAGGAICNRDSNPILIACTLTGNSATSDGGAMYNSDSNPVILNSTFSQNFASSGQGGGMYNRESCPALSNCRFERNIARTGWGGGISNQHSKPKFTACEFAGNSAWLGGGMYNAHSTVTVRNCLFTGNQACSLNVASSTGMERLPVTGEGGGMYHVFDQNSVLLNCTFAGNRASFRGGGIYNSDSDHPELTHCILWGNRDPSGSGKSAQIYGGQPDIAHSCIQGWYVSSGGNTSDDPVFARSGYWDPNGTPDDPNDDFWVDGDYHLKSQAGRWDANEGRWTKDEVTSPCIDAGDPTSPIGYGPFPNGGIINMGAYGGTAEASKSYFGEPICETIVAGDINGDCKVDFLDFTLLARHWLQERHLATDD